MMHNLNIGVAAYQFNPAAVFESTVQIGRDIVNSRPVSALVAVTKRGLKINALFLMLYSFTTAIAITVAVASGAILPILAAAMATTVLTCAITQTGLDAYKIHVNDKLQEQNAALSLLANTIAEREKLVNDNPKLSEYKTHLTTFNEGIEQHTANTKLANFERQFNRVSYVAFTIKSVADGSIFWSVINIGTASYTEYAKDSLAKETKMEDLVNNINELRHLTGVNSRDIKKILNYAVTIQAETNLLKKINNGEVDIKPEEFVQKLSEEENKIRLENLQQPLPNHTSPTKAIIKSLKGSSKKTDFKKIESHTKELLEKQSNNIQRQ